MDCNDAKTRIDLYIDDMLDAAEKKRLIRHTSSCTQCKKELDDAVRLKRALAGLKELEPPEGLAASAVRKARRNHINIWAYASVAVAAVVALMFAFSPALLPHTKNETGDDRLMYSATGEEMAQDSYESMDAVAAPETGEATTPADTESLVGAPAPEVKTSCAGITAYVDQTYSTEEEFCEALRAEAAAYYYRPVPTVLPGDAMLITIEVSEYSVRWVYRCGEDAPQTLVFEWYKNLTADEIAVLDTRLRNEDLTQFTQAGEIFWSSENRFNEDYQVEPDGTVIHAYWMQDGGAFHAELPQEFTEQGITDICEMEKVTIN